MRGRSSSCSPAWLTAAQTKSPYTKHFDVDNVVVKDGKRKVDCLLCRAAGSNKPARWVVREQGSTKGMKSHLERHHVKEYQEIETAKAKQEEAATAERLKRDEVWKKANVAVNAAALPALDQKTLRLLAAKAVALDFLPFTCFEGGNKHDKRKGMADFLDYVSYNRLSDGISHQTVSRGVYDLQQWIAIQLSKKLQALDSCSLATDGWTCRKAYISYTFTWVNTAGPTWQMERGCLHIQELPGNHTGEALGAAAAQAYDDAVGAAFDKGLREAIAKVVGARNIADAARAAEGEGEEEGGDDAGTDDDGSSSSSSSAEVAAALHPVQAEHRRKVWAIVADGCAAEQKGLDHMGEDFFHWQVRIDSLLVRCPFGAVAAYQVIIMLSLALCR